MLKPKGRFEKTEDLHSVHIWEDYILESHSLQIIFWILYSSHEIRFLFKIYCFKFITVMVINKVYIFQEETYIPGSRLKTRNWLMTEKEKDMWDFPNSEKMRDYTNNRRILRIHAAKMTVDYCILCKLQVDAKSISDE